MPRATVPMKLVLEDGRIFSGRSFGARGERVTEDLDDASLLAKARKAPDMNGYDLAKVVTCPAPYRWTEGLGDDGPWRPNAAGALTAAVAPLRRPIPAPGSAGRVVVIDYGVKR